MLSLKLLCHAQGRVVPTVGGILLFGRDREDHFPDAWIQCGRFEGKSKSKIFDHLEIHAHLPLAVEQAFDFIKKYSVRRADLSQLRRRDVWNIPMEIVREALINAVVHADYSQTGSPLRVAVFDDRVEIENPGILLPGLTLEDMRQGVSKPRNRVIGRTSRELGLVEQWGSGVLRMFETAQELGLPAPEIIELGSKLRVVIRLAESLSAPRIAPQDLSLPSKAHETPYETPHVTPKVAQLLNALNGARSRPELMAELNLTDRKHFRKTYLHPVLEADLIEMTLPETPKSRLQKYRLTKAGIAAQNAGAVADS